MRGGEIHAQMAIDDRSLQGFRQLNHQVDAFRRPRDTTGDDDGILGLYQHFRGLLHCSVIARGRRGQGELGDLQAPVGLGHRFFLHHRVGHDDHRLHGRRHRDFIRANGGFGETSQRHRSVIPLGVIANHRGSVLHAVRPFHVAASPCAILNIAQQNVDRDAIGVGVVDCH